MVFDGPDDLTGQRVALAQVGHPVAAQDRRDRPGRETELGADPVLSATLVAAQLQHPLLDLDRGASWAAVWTRGAVEQAGLALGAESGDPAVGALTGDAELLGDVRDRPTVLDHPRDEQTTTMQIQTSVSVGHEDLLVGEDVRHLH